DLAQPIAGAPVIAGYQIERVSDKVLSVAVAKDQGLNRLFIELSQRNIEVISLKNRTNRLEQLFMDLVDATPTEA
ncbi:MAG: ABC transporter ATP-binding protein, partial [Methylobacter sp.]|nr:ABC transporter ATP-binding protein [Methylobacter sp.]